MASSAVERKRTRGPNKGTPWSRRVDEPVSVLRLALDTNDPVQRTRIEDMFSAAFSIRRAVQSDARHRSRAYRAAHRERDADPAAVRTRLGLSRDALEDAASGHLNGAPHLRRFVTKALAMHLADSVWTATQRHLFRDASGKTLGMPRIGGWYDFTRLPGRARSHTKKRKWESFRLHGTLDGHRAAYTSSDGTFFQPARMRPVTAVDGRWWEHQGSLAVVFSGLPGGTLVLPVRLPAAPSNQAILDHHLADPARWHKIDLVRSQDPNAPGGWRYEAHLMLLTAPYVAPAVAARRYGAALDTIDRCAGIDVNVSNITVASHAAGRDLRITRIERDPPRRKAERRRAKRERRRQRALERSLRAANRAQYQLSKRQAKRARRREAAGLRPTQVIPAGPRLSRTDGKPLQAYRKDRRSVRYRRARAAQAADAASASQARRDHAREIAGALVRAHGHQLTVEDCDLRGWARRWGAALAAFSPGTLVSAIEREATAVAQLARGAGGVARASTRTTALSQHCLCGARVTKSLAERVHACPACGLRGDRDAVSAVLAACVVFAQRDNPASALVDLTTCRALLEHGQARKILFDTLDDSVKGRQDVLSESNALSAYDGSFIVWWGRTPDAVVVARRNVGTASRSTLDEYGLCGLTTPERSRTRTNQSTYGAEVSTPLRDRS